MMADSGKTDFLHENALKLDEVVTQQEDQGYDNPPTPYSPNTAVVEQPQPYTPVTTDGFREELPSNTLAIFASVYVILFCCLPVGCVALACASEYFDISSHVCDGQPRTFLQHNIKFEFHFPSFLF